MFPFRFAKRSAVLQLQLSRLRTYSSQLQPQSQLQSQCSSQVQRAAPEFTVKGVIGGRLVNDISRSALLKALNGGEDARYLLLVFYPLNFTFVCPTELTAYADRLEEFHREGCAVAGVSVDSEYSHLTWTKMKRSDGGLAHDNNQPFRLPMLSDLNRELSRAFGVLNSAGSVALRAQALIDPRGIVRHLSINDLGIGRSVDESLRLVQAVKFVDEHGGEVCPVNWSPGKASMKADPEGSKQYFSKK